MKTEEVADRTHRRDLSPSIKPSSVQSSIPGIGRRRNQCSAVFDSGSSRFSRQILNQLDRGSPCDLLMVNRRTPRLRAWTQQTLQLLMEKDVVLRLMKGRDKVVSIRT
ncbi:MAG: hypothetical protein R3F19_12080 [Verrucomicrobiales bacterium]